MKIKYENNCIIKYDTIYLKTNCQEDVLVASWKIQFKLRISDKISTNFLSLQRTNECAGIIM